MVRDGQRLRIAGAEVVCGDVLVLAEGDRVPADALLLEGAGLQLDESLLSGEALPVSKAVAAPDGGQVDGQARLYCGTLVVAGHGTARVVATGVHTEMGRIGSALESLGREASPLKRQMAALVRLLAWVAVGASLFLLLAFGLLRGDWMAALLASIALAMALLPQEFSVVLTVIPALGAWRLSQEQVLTRRLAAIETLGATSVLCADKTGTLTENRMQVVAIAGANDGPHWRAGTPGAASRAIADAFQTALSACPPDATDPMDLAILQLAQTGGLRDCAALQAGLPLRTYGLQRDLLAVTSIHAATATQGAQACAKGAFEAVAGLCRLSATQREHLQQTVDGLADQGMRVLALARAELTPARLQALPVSPASLPFTYCGLIAFADPLRTNVPAAVAECQHAGIRVVMITGDYPRTAAAIAASAGIDASEVLSGDEVEALSDAELALRAHTVSVFARIRPPQKPRIVQSLQARGEVVAMTGDGVNDAPAIRAADIGIAMGGRGTDVAREAAALVLLDDDFGSIVQTVQLGRRIYDNLRKAIEYIVAVHVPIAGLALMPLLFGLPMMLTPIHIAFLELVIDPACSVVFEAEGAEADVMRRPPRNPASPLLLPRRIVWAVLQGLVVLLVLGGGLSVAASRGVPENELRAQLFAALVLTNLGLILINRTFSSTLAGAVAGANRPLAVLVTAVTGGLAVALCWPPAQALFRFGPPRWTGLALTTASAALCLLLLEYLKRWLDPLAHNSATPIRNSRLA